MAKADPMTQPHYIDREAVKARLASILIDLTDPDEPCPSDADIARAIIDAMIALSAPTEAVAALSSRPVDDTGGEFSGVNPEAVAWRARFVTSTDGREWSDWVYEEGPYLGGLDPQANDIQPLYTAPPPITGEGVRG